MLTISTRSSPAMMSSVPLPWWTSKSTIATRSRPRTSSACRAATATLLKKQKPIACARVAWWPGGRTAQNAFSTSPSMTASVAATAAPAARITACQVPAAAIVSASMSRGRPSAAIRSQHVAQLGDVAALVRQVEVVGAHHRRLAQLEGRVEAGGAEVVVDRVEPLRALGMAVAHVVAAAIGMAVEGRCHWAPESRRSVGSDPDGARFSSKVAG